jgi:hypothetical protein
VRTIGAGGATAAGEVGAGVACVGYGVGAAMNGIGVGAIDVAVVDAQAVSIVINNAAIKSRRTQVATEWRYADDGMSCGHVRLQ